MLNFLFLARVSGRDKPRLTIRLTKHWATAENIGHEKENKTHRFVLRWFGHLSRMNEDRKPRQFFEARPDGGRPRGKIGRAHV